MSSLLLNRVAIILDTLAGLLLAPELLGTERIERLHRASVRMTATVLAVLASTYRPVREMRQEFSKPFSVVLFASALVCWVCLVAGLVRRTESVIPQWVLALVLVALSVLTTVVLSLLFSQGNVYARLHEKAQGWRRTGRPKSQFGSFVEDVVVSYVIGLVMTLTLLAYIVASPAWLFLMTITLVLFVVSRPVGRLLSRLIVADLRYALLKIGGILFILGNLLQCLALSTTP